MAGRILGPNNGHTSLSLGIPLSDYGATSAPTASDDALIGYTVGSIIVDTSTNIAYICVDSTAAAAVWLLLGNTPLQSNNVLTVHKNLVITENTGTPNSQVDIDSDDIVVEDSNNISVRLSSVNLTANIVNSGLNGLDTGSEASNTWYYIWVIYDGTTTASLLSISSTAPTLPSGYTHKGLVGVLRNDGSSNFLGFNQVGSKTRLDRQIRDVDDSATGTTANTPTLTVPPSLTARISVELQENGTSFALITATSQTNLAASSSTSTLRTLAGGTASTQSIEVELNASSQMRYRASVNTLIRIYTFGWLFE